MSSSTFFDVVRRLYRIISSAKISFKKVMSLSDMMIDKCMVHILNRKTNKICHFLYKYIKLSMINKFLQHPLTNMLENYV